MISHVSWKLGGQKLSSNSPDPLHERALAVVRDYKLKLEKRETLRRVTKNLFRLHLGLRVEVVEKLKRVQTLEVSRARKNLNFEETLDRVLDDYLNRKDPLRKVTPREDLSERIPQEMGSIALGIAKRESSIVNLVPKNSILDPKLRNEVLKRDQGKCQYTSSKGVRCMGGRFVEVHPIKPMSEGGFDVAENLISLCWSHHHLWHRQNSQ